jgi:DNA polymerase (family 10)
MDKKEVANALDEFAQLLELTGENAFKTRAYVNGARQLRALEGDLEAMVREGKLREVPGFGATLVARITELVTTGTSPALEALRAQIPSGLAALLRIEGLGPKRVREIHKALGVTNVAELEAACVENRLAVMAGFGEKTQAKILAGIALLKKRSGRFLYDVAAAEGEKLVAAFDGHAAVKRIALAGSVRRCRETVGDLDIVVATDDRPAVMGHFLAQKGIDETIAHGDTKTSVRLFSGLQVDLRAVTDEEFPATLLYFTGSKEHNVALRARAIKRGLRLNEYGLFREDGTRLDCPDEPALYRALDLDDVPPELREDTGEIDAAEKHALPALLEARDLRGVLHCHSLYSDGRNTVREMALAAKDLGYAYIGMTDHSRSAAYANGMKPDDVKRQHEEIDALNAELEGIVILKGTESDILADGALDFDEATLASFDFVIGSVHSRFGMTREEMTKRLLTAIANPYLDVLGHVTGRLLLAREPYAVDLEAVLAAAAEAGVVVEMNANPHRLDLDWREGHAFKKKGGMVSINPDAHRSGDIADVRYGVGIARKAWMTKDDVLNTRSVDELRARFSRRRTGRP